MGRRSSRLSIAAPAAAVLALGVLAGLAGCQSESEAQLADVRFNPTPEIMTPTQRADDIDNQVHTGFDTNWRSFNRDWGVIWLTDKPSRLSPYPMR